MRTTAVAATRAMPGRSKEQGLATGHCLPVLAVRRGGAALLLLAGLVTVTGGCGSAQRLDASLRRIDILDRVFVPTTATADQHDPPVSSSEAAVMAPPSPALRAPANPGSVPEPTVTAAAVAEEPPQDQTTPGLGAGGGEAAASSAARVRLLARQNPWLTRFWAELTPPQQQRVEQAFRRAARLPATAPLTPATPWDALGLADRVELVFGPGHGSSSSSSSDDDG